MESGPETRRELRTAEVLLTMFHFGDTDHGRHEKFAWERFEALERFGGNAQQLMKSTDALRECFEYLTDKVVKEKMSTRILPHVERQWGKSKLMEIDVHVWDRMHAEHPNRNIEYILGTIDGEIERVRRIEALECQDKPEEARKVAYRTLGKSPQLGSFNSVAAIDGGNVAVSRPDIMKPQTGSSYPKTGVTIVASSGQGVSTRSSGAGGSYQRE